MTAPIVWPLTREACSEFELRSSVTGVADADRMTRLRWAEYMSPTPGQLWERLAERAEAHS